MRDEPAFPRPASIDPVQGTLPDGDRVIEQQDGMTLRDYFAAKVEYTDSEHRNLSMADKEQLLGRPCPKSAIEKMDWWIELEAVIRYRKADAMLAARAKPTEIEPHQ